MIPDHSATTTFAKPEQDYGEGLLSNVQLFRQLKAFSEGSELVEEEPRSGSPSKTDKMLTEFGFLCILIIVQCSGQNHWRKIKFELHCRSSDPYQHWGRVLCGRVRPRNITSKPGMAHFNLTKAKKAKMSKSKIKCMLIVWFFIAIKLPTKTLFFKVKRWTETLWSRVLRVRPNITTMRLSQSNFDQQIFCKQKHSCGSLTFLFPWFQSMTAYFSQDCKNK